MIDLVWFDLIDLNWFVYVCGLKYSYIRIAGYDRMINQFGVCVCVFGKKEMFLDGVALDKNIGNNFFFEQEG